MIRDLHRSTSIIIIYNLSVGNWLPFMWLRTKKLSGCQVLVGDSCFSWLGNCHMFHSSANVLLKCCNCHIDADTADMVSWYRRTFYCTGTKSWYRYRYPILVSISMHPREPAKKKNNGALLVTWSQSNGIKRAQIRFPRMLHLCRASLLRTLCVSLL